MNDDSSSSSVYDAGSGPVRRRRVLASEHHHVETVVDWLEDLAGQHGLGDELLNRLLVAVSEAVNNSLCHGNQLNPVRDVVVEVTLTSDSVDVVVEDEGIGFEPERIENPLAEDNLWKEGGRGVYLMEKLTDDVRFENDGRRVFLHFER